MKRTWQSIRKLFFRAANRFVGERTPVDVTEASGSETNQSHYLLIAYPHDYGWVSIMPDFAGATGRADEMQQAMIQALGGALRVCSVTMELGKPLPVPSDLALLKNDRLWARVYGVDWSRAVVQTVPKDKLIARVQREIFAIGLTSDARTYAPR